MQICIQVLSPNKRCLAQCLLQEVFMLLHLEHSHPPPGFPTSYFLLALLCLWGHADLPYSRDHSLYEVHYGRLQLFSKAFRGDSCSSLFQAKGTWGSLETLAEAETSFLGFTLLSWGPKAEPGPNMSIPAGKQAHGFECWCLCHLSEGHMIVFSSMVAESRTGAAATPGRNLNLGLLPALLFSLSVYTKDRPHSMVSVQPNHDTHWAVNTHANTKRKRKRKSGSLSISLGMFICPS